ncbi:hypothetical protein SAMN05444392_108132 [Seinonella peptonophila]|uniref:Uncharacterized protein n=1 Tax=Seinonella peptonophila TaxID=112248 RepID=A0A1M4ZAZ3_9BACL|nr:hypothetical protein SAMN05444392_108132 [Seinonella peptonophila]
MHPSAQCSEDAGVRVFSISRSGRPLNRGGSSPLTDDEQDSLLTSDGVLDAADGQPFERLLLEELDDLPLPEVGVRNDPSRRQSEGRRLHHHGDGDGSSRLEERVDHVPQAVEAEVLVCRPFFHRKDSRQELVRLLRRSEHRSHDGTSSLTGLIERPVERVTRSLTGDVVDQRVEGSPDEGGDTLVDPVPSSAQLGGVEEVLREDGDLVDQTLHRVHVPVVEHCGVEVLPKHHVAGPTDALGLDPHPLVHGVERSDDLHVERVRDHEVAGDVPTEIEVVLPQRKVQPFEAYCVHRTPFGELVVVSLRAGASAAAPSRQQLLRRPRAAFPRRPVGFLRTRTGCTPPWRGG